MSPFMPAKNPDNYSIVVPQVLFSPTPVNGNYQTWCDHVALQRAFIGVTNSMGQVQNSFGVSVGSAKEIIANTYLGALSETSIGGDMEELKHSVSNLGREEVDRVITISQSKQYELKFDEPDVKNMARFLVGEEASIGMPLKALNDMTATFIGSNGHQVTIVGKAIGDPSQALESIRSLWRVQGGIGEPADGTYGFIIGGTNEQECVGPWKNRRQWIAYTDFDFTAGTQGAWSYMRPHGTAIGGSYGTDKVIDVNSTILSIPDSSPIVGQCAAIPAWNANTLLAWSGFNWVDCSDGFYGLLVIGTTKSFKRTEGAALVVANTTVGRSLFHSIPRGTLIPSGNMDYAMDNWTTGGFTLNVQMDSTARMVDSPAKESIPYGYIQMFTSMV